MFGCGTNSRIPLLLVASLSSKLNINLFWWGFAVRYPCHIHCINLIFTNVQSTIATCHFVNVTITNHAATIFENICFIVAFSFECKMLLMKNGHAKQDFICVFPLIMAN